MSLLLLLKPTLGGGSKPDVEFDLQSKTDQSIVCVTADVGRELALRFARDPKQLLNMNRRKFEELIAEIWDKFGYEVELTKRTRDGGRDVIAIKKKEVMVKYLIDCKRPDPGNSVDVSTVREMYGIKTDERATKGIIVTTTRFTKDAKEFVEKHQWELEARDYSDVTNWLEQYAKLCGV